MTCLALQTIYEALSVCSLTFGDEKANCSPICKVADISHYLGHSFGESSIVGTVRSMYHVLSGEVGWVSSSTVAQLSLI